MIAGLGRGLAPGGRRTALVGGRRPRLAPPRLHRPGCVWPPGPVGGASRRVLGIAERLLVEAKTGGRDWPAALAVAASPVAAIPVVRQAMRRQQSWKGRQYQ